MRIRQARGQEKGFKQRSLREFEHIREQSRRAAMKILRQDGHRTRRKLLQAAGQIFAEKGYQDAKITEICQRAGTNTAVINYHFRNKETLYKEA